MLAVCDYRVCGLCGVAEWSAYLPSDREVAGSSPARVINKICSVHRVALMQLVNTYKTHTHPWSVGPEWTLNSVRVLRLGYCAQS